jgi:hypothetical protein
MADREPLTDDEVEMLLHEVMRQIVEAKHRGAVTPEGKEAMRLAMTGPLGALMRLAKRDAGEEVPQLD